MRALGDVGRECGRIAQPRASSAPATGDHVRIGRRNLLLAALVLPIAATRNARAETALPRPDSLPEAAASSAARGEPLVLLISLPGCPYCERVRRSELLPMAREGGGNLFQIDIGASTQVIDFDGAARTHDAVASRLQARYTPTVLFLGPTGTELSERLVGAGIPDFYGAMLEQRLQEARAALQYAADIKLSQIVTFFSCCAPFGH